MSSGTKERILLKFSGANLKNASDSDVIFDNEILLNLTKQIKVLSEKYAVSVVVGGGNIWRGKDNSLEPLSSSDSHVIGMLATFINSIAFQNYLRHQGVTSVIFSSISCPRIAEDLNIAKVNQVLDSGSVVLFAAGTGIPYVSTDTCAAVRALEIKAEKILIGKNGVKGVYDKDPAKHKDASFYPQITYEKVIEDKLGVMDLTSMALLRENTRPKLIVFSQSEEDAFIKVLEGKIEYTEVY